MLYKLHYFEETIRTKVPEITISNCPTVLWPPASPEPSRLPYHPHHYCYSFNFALLCHCTRLSPMLTSHTMHFKNFLHCIRQRLIKFDFSIIIIIAALSKAKTIASPQRLAIRSEGDDGFSSRVAGWQRRKIWNERAIVETCHILHLMSISKRTLHYRKGNDIRT